MPRTSKKKTGTTFTSRIAKWMFTPMRLGIFAVIALGWLCWPSIQNTLPQLDDRPEYRVGVEQIEVTPPPRWVPEDIVQKAFARANFDESLSLLDPELSEKIALAFYTYPWVERLKEVRKSYPARVYVDVVYRRPVAMVEISGGGTMPIDRHGVLLPEQDFSPSDFKRYPLIKGISTVPLGFQGEAWGDPAVAGAAELAAVLTESSEDRQSWWASLGLKNIVAPRRLSVNDELDDLQFELQTNQGSEIVWGRAPSTRHPGELTVAQKLKRMSDLHQSQGFDSGPAAVRFDIRDWERITTTVIAAEPRRTSRQ